MTNNSRNINIFGGIDKLDPNISIPDTWAANSNRNIQDSQSKFVTTNWFSIPTLSLFKDILSRKFIVLCYFHILGARSRSMRLRGTVDSTVTQCANDMWSSWNTSNSALQQRVAETTTAHNNLQSHLARTNQEIYDQQKHIAQLQKAIRDKEAPLMVNIILI